MATKGKDKIIDGQIAFDFLGEIEVVKPKKKPKKVVKVEEKKQEKPIRVFKYKKPKVKVEKRKNKKKKFKCIKHNHFKKSRKTRRMLFIFLCAAKLMVDPLAIASNFLFRLEVSLLFIFLRVLC